MSVATTMRRKLEAAFAPARLEIVDESDRHIGHAGARPGGETHFRVVLVAEGFAGVGRIERQRRVHRCLATELADHIHALSLTVLTPDEEQAVDS
jgi:BolA protein